MDFFQFLSDPDQLEVFIYYFDDYRCRPIKIKNQKKMILEENEGVVQVTFNLSRYAKQIQEKKMLFIARLKVENTTQQHFPYPVSGKKRWLGALLRVPNSYSLKGVYQELEYKIDQMKHLQTLGKW